MCGVASPLENVHPVSLPWVLPRRTPLGPAHHTHVDVKRPRRAAFSPVTAEPSALPGGHPAREYVSDAARTSREARSMIFRGLHSRGLRASRVRNPVIRRRAVSFFVVSLASKKKKSVEGDASVRNQCAKSENRENEHPFAKKMTVNHWKKRYAFDKIVQPFFGHFSGVSDHRSLIIGRVAIRGVFRFSRICRDLVRDLPRTHLNARVHRDRDVHPLTRP